MEDIQLFKRIREISVSAIDDRDIRTSTKRDKYQQQHFYGARLTSPSREAPSKREKNSVRSACIRFCSSLP